MKLLPTLTEAEQGAAWLNSLILRMGEASHHLAAVADAVNTEFWSTLPTDRLMALLNSDIPRTLGILGGNSALAQAVNPSLDSLGIETMSRRIPTELGRTDIAFNGTVFVYTPPQEEQPQE
jgi:hypothetical protein